MKVPLEPIPTEQMSVAEKAAAPKRSRRTGAEAPAAPAAAPSAQLNKAYPWLLGTSLCMSGVLCWLYVTKPVMAPAAVQTPVQSESAEVSAPVMVKPGTAATADEAQAAALAPSETRLPGEQPAQVSAAQPVAPDAPLKVDPRKLAAMRGSAPAGGIGWESTNLKVQHILSADSGSGELEKIILNVPVRYQSRTMRWSAADIEKARNVLGRLMVYERDLYNLRQQGKGILKDWNALLANTVPAAVLRADSPSLPYNQGHGGSQADLPDSSSVIKVDNPDAPQN